MMAQRTGGTAATKKCFVISPIGDPESEVRKRADQILKHVIRPAVEPDYCAQRADEIADPGLITSQVIQRVVDDDLVVADLTGHNPNVFYELALRHAVRKPLVQIIRKGDQIPFDVAGMRTVQVDHKDLDSVDHAVEELRAQIRATEADPTKIETPISVSMDLQALRTSSDPEQRSIADILSVLAETQKGVAGIQARLADPEAFIPAELLQSLEGRRMGRRHPAYRELREALRRTEELVSKEKASVSELREAMLHLRAVSEFFAYAEYF